MTRTILAAAAAAFAMSALLAPAAQACISCNYVPEVVHTPSPHDAARRAVKLRAAGAAAQQQRAAIAAAQRKAAAAKQQQLAKAAAAKRAQFAKAQQQEQKQVAEVAPEADTTTEDKAVETTPVKVADAAAEIGCRKFSPTIGTTIEVPCE